MKNGTNGKDHKIAYIDGVAHPIKSEHTSVLKFVREYVGDQRVKGIVRCPDYRPMKHGGNYGLVENWFAYKSWGKPHRRLSEIQTTTIAGWAMDVFYEGSNVNASEQFYTGRNWSNWHYRHLDQIDIAFADGHVADEKRILSGIDGIWTGK